MNTGVRYEVASPHGPAQSNGMCLLEFVVHWNLYPNASTEQTTDLPQVTSCPGAGLGARRVHELGIFSRQTRRASQGLGPGFNFADNLGSPLSTIGRNLEDDPRTLNAANLAAFSKQCCDERRESSDLATENPGKHFSLAFVGTLVDEDASSPFCLPRPEIAFPSSHADEAQIIEIDITVAAITDVPEQNRFTKAVVRCLGECAGACDSAATVVEPVSGDVPAGNLGHQDFHPP